MHRYVSAIYRKKGERVVLKRGSGGETEEERGKGESGGPLEGKDPQLLTLRASHSVRGFFFSGGFEFYCVSSFI